MKILVVGGGGREHALVWKLKQSKRVDEIFCAPGNAGIANLAMCVDIGAGDIPELIEFAKVKRIDLTVVGPEAPLVAGIVDAFKRDGLRIFGPSKEAAVLEGSKAFTKEFCKKYNIPSSEFEIFTDAEKAKEYAKTKKLPLVVKADGLAAGKGVIICRTLKEVNGTIDDIITNNRFGVAGSKIVIEEFLTGEEASFIAISDGNHVLPMAGSQDHKPAYDDDKGPNTGGMGAISPAKILTPEMAGKVMEKIILPTARGMVTEGMPFVGVLYAGLMIKDDEPKVLEYNVRFGDPETQALLMRLKTDLVDVFDATTNGLLNQVSLSWDPRPAVCVVMAAGGYPGTYEKGKAISGLEEAAKMDDVAVFHAGTKCKGDQVVTNGGRVLGVTALGDDYQGVIDRAYEAVNKISWDGIHFRRDIGNKALG